MAKTVIREYDTRPLTIYSIPKQKDELLKFHSATKLIKATTENCVLWKPKLKQLDNSV